MTFIFFISIIYLSPLFFLSLNYSGLFILLFVSYFLKFIILFAQVTLSYKNEAFYAYSTVLLLTGLSSSLIIIYKKSIKDLYLKTQRLNNNFIISLRKYAFNKNLILYCILSQLLLIISVFILSPNLSILSFNRDSTISLTVKGIRYIYPFFLALSPTLFSASLLSLINFKSVRRNPTHYLLAILSIFSIFLIGQRGFLFVTLFISLLTSFIFSLYRLSKAKINIQKIRYWIFLVFLWPFAYNLRNIGNLNNLEVKTADLLQIKAWEGTIQVTEQITNNYPPILNNIYLIF